VSICSGRCALMHIFRTLSPTPSVSRAAVVVAFTSLAAARLFAHDFWIEPSTFRPSAGTTFTASLRVGQDFAGDAVPRSASLMESFTVRDAKGERTVNGFENQDPAGYVRLEQEGAALIGYRSKASVLETTPAKFAQFLREEGIAPIAENTPVHREHFYRYAKAIVATPAAAKHKTTSVITRPLNYRLELVPVTDPMNAAPLELRLLFEQKPLPGALVVAIARENGARVEARTDARGRVKLVLPRGAWLVKAVHLVAAPQAAGVPWESLWASLTFQR
jgi:uncharacterized GH25 family protein